MLCGQLMTPSTSQCLQKNVTQPSCSHSNNLSPNRVHTSAMAQLPADESDGQRGVIINVASVAGIEGQKGQVGWLHASVQAALSMHVRACLLSQRDLFFIVTLGA
jgi:hypothetical protein